MGVWDTITLATCSRTGVVQQMGTYAPMLGRAELSRVTTAILLPASSSKELPQRRPQSRLLPLRMVLALARVLARRVADNRIPDAT